MAAVLKRRRELRKAMRVARMLAALDAAAGSTRAAAPGPRPRRAALGSRV
jgi:hypothetical protein